VEEHVLAIVAEPDVDFDRFDGVSDRAIESRCGVFRRRAQSTAMSNNLNCTRRTDRLEERRLLRTGCPVRTTGKKKS
jgi:hypothetical protein